MLTSVLDGVEKQNSVSYDSCPQSSSSPVMDKIEIGSLFNKCRDFHWWSSGWDSELPMQEARVPSLIVELRFGAAK